VTGVSDLVSARLGLIGLGPAPTASSGHAQLMLTTNFGRTFSDIGPRTDQLTEPDSIFFLDRQHGWFATFSILNLAENVYRTSNGGRTWQAFAAPGHNQAAGSADYLQFLTPADGWLVDVVANAPAEELFRTTDGGSTWRLVATLNGQRPHGVGTLPALGMIRFEPGGMTGWLSNNLFGSPLYRTTDGGRSWRQVHLRAPSGAAFGPPAVFGRTLAEPVTVGAGGTASLRIYISRDDGETWSLASTLQNAASRSCSGPLPTSFPGQAVAWAAAFRDSHVVVYRTTSQGKSWTPLATPAPASRQFCGPDQIEAVGAGRAWLTTPGPYGSNAPRIYATTTAGHTWQRITLIRPAT